MKKFLITILAATGWLIVEGQNADTLRNDAIIKMHQSGLSKEVILKKIQTTSIKRFDVDTDALIQLKKFNIPDTVVLSMMELPANAFPLYKATEQLPTFSENISPLSYEDIKAEGLYYYDLITESFTSIPNNKSTRFMMDGKTYITGGFSSKKEFQFPNTKAVTRLETNEPELYLKAETFGSVLEPNNFILFKGEVVGRKDFRKVLWTGAGITDNNKLSRNATKPIVERISNDLYKISFPKRLELGSYFLGPRDNPHQVCFDFDIIPKSKATPTTSKVPNEDKKLNTSERQRPLRPFEKRK